MITLFLIPFSVILRSKAPKNLSPTHKITENHLFLIFLQKVFNLGQPGKGVLPPEFIHLPHDSQITCRF